jgi:hypothetical protein
LTGRPSIPVGGGYPSVHSTVAAVSTVLIGAWMAVAGAHARAPGQPGDQPILLDAARVVVTVAAMIR